MVKMKAATDADIAFLRGSSKQDDALIARIDTERAARLAAEARVKVLEERLRELIGHLEIASVMPSATGKAYAPTLDADFLERARSALKEPANG